MNNKSLLLIWQDEESRLYFHVGTLNYNGSLYQFEYTHQIKADRRVHDAINYGYTLHPAFTNLTKKYESKKLFPAFARRIPSPNRVDYGDVLKALSLPKDADEMDLLRTTRGMMGKNPYSFYEPLRLIDGNVLMNNFYINGMRHSELANHWYETIEIGEELYLERDLKNPKDPNAVKVLTSDQMQLGYVPGVFAKAVSALLERKVTMSVVVEDMKPTFSPQWWVHVNFKSVLEQTDLPEGIDELAGLVILVA